MKNIFTTILLLCFTFIAQAQDTTDTYNCIQGYCVEALLIEGEFGSLEACELECGIEADTLELEGQWYGTEDEDYLMITSDSIFIYYDNGDCFELEDEFSYTLIEGTDYFTIETEGMTIPVSYELGNENLSLYAGDPVNPMEYVSTSFDMTDLCEETANWLCGVEGCEEVEAGNGEFESQEECEWECYTGEMTYYCGDIGCVEANQWGDYDSLEECEAECGQVEMTYACWPQGCFEAGFEGDFTSMEECEAYCAEAYSWSCGVEGCEEVGAGNGSFDSEEECEEECYMGEMTYECYQGACYEANDFGSYSSMEECEEACEGQGVTYACVLGDCIEAGSFGNYDSMEACVEECEEDPSTTYACVFEACVEFGEFGEYNTLEECQEECEGTSAIEEVEGAVQLAPNPFNYSTLLIFEADAHTYSVYDMSGRLVREEAITAKQHRFYRNELPAGMYYLEVQGTNTKWRSKLMIK